MKVATIQAEPTNAEGRASAIPLRRIRPHTGQQHAPARILQRVDRSAVRMSPRLASQADDVFQAIIARHDHVGGRHPNIDFSRIDIGPYAV